jgi:hypothetical protein
MRSVTETIKARCTEQWEVTPDDKDSWIAAITELPKAL